MTFHLKNDPFIIICWNFEAFGRARSTLGQMKKVTRTIMPFPKHTAGRDKDTRTTTKMTEWFPTAWEIDQENWIPDVLKKALVFPLKTIMACVYSFRECFWRYRDTCLRASKITMHYPYPQYFDKRWNQFLRDNFTLWHFFLTITHILPPNSHYHFI